MHQGIPEWGVWGNVHRAIKADNDALGDTLPIPQTAINVAALAAVNNAELINDTTTRPAGVIDGHVVAFRTHGDGDLLLETDDDGDSWTQISQLPHRGIDPSVNSIAALDDGELLVGVASRTGESVSVLYKSSGWDWDSPGDATWVSVLESTGEGADFIPRCLSVDGNVVVAGEYGTYGVSRRVWLSEDYGNTFTEIFDAADFYEDISGVHLHGVEFDPWNSRIWMCHGDAVEGIYYTDPPYSSWTLLDDTYQMTTITALKSGVYFGSDDGTNGMLRVRRRSSRRPLEIEVAHQVDVSGALAYWARGAQVGSDGVVYVTFQAIQSPGTTDPILLASADDGETWQEIWEGSDSYYLIRDVWGPTPDGKLLASRRIGGQVADWRIFRSDAPLRKFQNVDKPAVSGSTGSNAALESLISALVDLGLVTDSTS